MNRRQAQSVQRRLQRGAAAVELAVLSAIFLFPIGFAIIEFGRAMYHFDVLTKSARDAARYLSTQSETSAGSRANLLARARCVALTGSASTTQTGCSGTVLVPNAANVTPATIVKICDAVDSSACTGISHNRVSTATASGNVIHNLVTVRIEGISFGPFVDWIASTAKYGTVSATFSVSP
jgi:Flp pilus assembly protein TadG